MFAAPNPTHAPEEGFGRLFEPTLRFDHEILLLHLFDGGLLPVGEAPTGTHVLRRRNKSGAAEIEEDRTSESSATNTETVKTSSSVHKNLTYIRNSAKFGTRTHVCIMYIHTYRYASSTKCEKEERRLNTIAIIRLPFVLFRRVGAQQ